MYEARQNKEKVSRRIDEGGRTRQRVKLRDENKKIDYRKGTRQYFHHHVLSLMKSAWSSIIFPSSGNVISVAPQRRKKADVNYSFAFGKDFNDNHKEWVDQAFIVKNSYCNFNGEVFTHNELKSYNFRIALQNNNGIAEVYGKDEKGTKLITHFQRLIGQTELEYMQTA